MPTAPSLTEARLAAADLAALLRFRRSGLSARESGRLRLAGLLAVVATVAAVVGPALLGGEFPRRNAGSVLALIPSLGLGFLALATFSAIAAGGGREVVPREQAVSFPISPATEHLGALLFAPLNIAWIGQAWALLGAASYALGGQRLLAYQLPLLLWIVTATALAQTVGWWAEGVRRGPHGIVLFRLIITGLALVVGAVIATGRLGAVLDSSPTIGLLHLVIAARAGDWASYLLGIGVLLALTAAAVVAGAKIARWALVRPMREELRLEAGHQRVRPIPASDLLMVLRIDRSAVWRSVPLRRGLLVLAVMPAAVALAGALEWSMVTVLPGLVASGGALLFGVNTWCLDGRGALWRESLPVSPRVVFAARALLLFEVLAGSALLTLLLAGLRAGLPTAVEGAAVLSALVVISVQVVSASMRWSIARPYAVDLRGARATPAPPVVMVGYSVRLAVSTTVTGLVFSALTATDSVPVILMFALLMALWSLWRLERASLRWARPDVRSRVVGTVAG